MLESSTMLAEYGTVKRAAHVCRVLLGLIMVVFGANGFIGVMPDPPVSDGGVSFMRSIQATGYLYQFLDGTLVITGALLLTNQFVPLALTILAPIVVNILAYQLFLGPKIVPLGVLIFGLELYLAWAYRAAFGPVLERRAQSTGRNDSAPPSVA